MIRTERPCSSRALALAALAAAGLALACSSEKPGPSVSLAAITPRWTGVRPGGTVQLHVTATMSDATVQDATARAAWVSKDPSIATVKNGLVTGVRPGTVLIEVLLDGHVFDGRFVKVAAIHAVDRTLVASPAGYVQQPSAAIDEAGRAIVGFGIAAPQNELVLMSAEVGVSPAWKAWSLDEYWALSGNHPRIAMSGSGAFAVGNWLSYDQFTITWFDGSAPTWRAVVDGGLLSLVMTRDGTLFAAYTTPGRAGATVARYDAAGFIDATAFPSGHALHANRDGGLMLMGAPLASYTFDGVRWSGAIPWGSDVNPAGESVRYYESGEADAISRGPLVYHFHYDGTAWGAATYVGPRSAGAVDGTSEAAAAADDAGRIALVYFRSPTIQDTVAEARVFDGASWGPAVPLGDATSWKKALKVFADGAGRFVALWEEPGSVAATYHDGAWHEVDRVADLGTFNIDPVMNRDGSIVLVNDCEGYDTLSASFLAFEPP